MRDQGHAPVTMDHAGGRPLHILLVEDEILIALELESLLVDIGQHCVGIAATLDEAVAMAKDCHPDLTLVDVHLADGPTGVEVARRLSAEGRTVLFMTANAKRIPPDLVGAWGVIDKPYTERAVQDAVGFVWSILNDEPPHRVPDGLTLAPDLPALLEERAENGFGRSSHGHDRRPASREA